MRAKGTNPARATRANLHRFDAYGHETVVRAAETAAWPEGKPRSPFSAPRTATVSRTFAGRPRSTIGFATFATIHAAVPPAPIARARRGRRRMSARTAVAGTVPNVPYCIGTQITGNASLGRPFAIRKTRISAGVMGRRAIAAVPSSVATPAAAPARFRAGRATPTPKPRAPAGMSARRRSITPVRSRSRPEPRQCGGPSRTTSDTGLRPAASASAAAISPTIPQAPHSSLGSVWNAAVPAIGPTTAANPNMVPKAAW
jgi:hypothetical protein